MIRVAKTAGFCFGVNRAVETVYKLLDEDKTVCTLGPIIHNPQLVEELGRKGVRIIDAPEDAKAGETVTIKKITGRDELRRHLAELGFVVDNDVTVVNEMAGNLIVQVKGSRVAVNREMANCILFS